MIIFIYACLNDLLFTSMGQLKYITTHIDIEMPCYVYVIFYFLTEFAHLQAINLVLLIAYARYIYAKHVTDVKSRITKRGVHISVIVTKLYAMIISFAPIVPFLVKRYSLYMVGKLLNAVFMGVAIALIFVCYLRGFKHIQLRMVDRQVQRNLTLAGQKYFVSMVTIIAMILLLHVPYTLSTIVETTFVYSGNRSIPLWSKFYHLVSNTIHRLFPTANQSVFIYNNSQIRRFMISKLKSVILCSSNVNQGEADGSK